MERGTTERTQAIDMRPFKDKLRKKLPPDSPVLVDLLNSLTPSRQKCRDPRSAYLQRLERELEGYEANPSDLGGDEWDTSKYPVK